MVKIINGKRYNTETETQVGHFWNGLSTGDFRNVNESLYVTKKGNFFLYGEGGPLSKYAEAYGNTTTGGSDFIPLSKNEAFKWCEKHTDSETIEKYFPDMWEDA